MTAAADPCRCLGQQITAGGADSLELLLETQHDLAPPGEDEELVPQHLFACFVEALRIDHGANIPLTSSGVKDTRNSLVRVESPRREELKNR